jgi:hypothetical protein
MPNYAFVSVKDSSVSTELFYHMADAPSVGSVVTVEGVQWRRVFTMPQASFDTKCDPYSAKDFVKATNKGKGTVGDLWDRSKEMSLKRADKDGSDPVRDRYFKDYQRRHKGTKHPAQQREDGVKHLASKGIKVDYGTDD